MKNIHKQFVEKYSNAVTDMKKTKILKLTYHSNGKKTERWLERKKKPRTFKSCMLNLKCKKITAKKSSVVIQSRHWIIQVQYRDYTHVWQGFACLGPNKAMLRTQQGTQAYRLSALSGYIQHTVPKLTQNSAYSTNRACHGWNGCNDTRRVGAQTKRPKGQNVSRHTIRCQGRFVLVRFVCASSGVWVRCTYVNKTYTVAHPLRPQARLFLFGNSDYVWYSVVGCGLFIMF